MTGFGMLLGYVFTSLWGPFGAIYTSIVCFIVGTALQICIFGVK